MGQRRPKRAHSSSSDEDEEMVRISLLHKQKEANKDLRRRNKRLEERIEALEEKNGKLQDLLHNKLGKLYVIG